MYINQCLTDCPQGWYEDSADFKCKQCYQGGGASDIEKACYNCIAGEKTNCTQCSGTYLYYGNNTCLANCPDGYYKYGSECKICYQYDPANPTYERTCKTCTGGNSNQCATCLAGEYLFETSDKKCITPCPDGYWGNTDTPRGGVCERCYTAADSTTIERDCATCDAGLNTRCLSCNESTYLYTGNNTCLKVCPDGWYEHDSSTGNLCLPCYAYTSADPDYYTCKTCDGPSKTECGSCHPGTFLNESNTACVNPCPDGYWGDTSDYKCKPCHAASSSADVQRDCRTCFGPLGTSCITCKDNTMYFMVEKTCLETCPAGYYSTGAIYPNNLCKRCYLYDSSISEDGTCNTCTGPNSYECTSCNSTQFLDSTTGKCVNACPIGYFKNHTTHTCDQCYRAPASDTPEQDCYTCDGGSSRDCSACSGSNFYYTANKSCLITCPAGYWGNSSGHQCVLCYQYKASAPNLYTCATCNGGLPNNCQSCNSGTYLDTLTSTCVSVCPDGYYGDNSSKTCLECYKAVSSTDINKDCKTCYGGGNNQCTSCNSGTYFLSVNNSCLGDCPAGWYQNSTNNSCGGCYMQTSPSANMTCLTCNGPAYSNCLSCGTSSYLYSPDKVCLATCPDGWFRNNNTSTCDQCYQATSSSDPYRTCKTCTGGSPTNCLTCLSHEYLDPVQKKCIAACSVGWYIRSDSNVCDKCYIHKDEEPEHTCQTCYGPNGDNCKTCTQGIFFYNGNNTCLKTCPDGYYADNSTYLCKPCYSQIVNDTNYGCATCNGPESNQCLSCFSPLFYFEYNHTCGSLCPAEKYWRNTDKNLCGPCDHSCDTCIGPDIEDCLFTADYSLNSISSSYPHTSQAQASGIVTEAAMASVTSVSIATNIASGATTLAAATVMSILGMLSLYQYLNVKYPTNLLVYFQYLFSIDGFFPNLFLIIWNPGDKIIYNDSRIPGENKFHSYKVSFLFIKNYGGWLSFLLCLILCAPIVSLTCFILKKAKSRQNILETAERIRDWLQWNFIITIFIASFLPLVFSLTLQIKYSADLSNSVGSFSLAMCGLMTAAAIIAVILLGVYTQIKNLDPKTRPQLVKRTQALINSEQSPASPNTATKYWAPALCLKNFVLVPMVTTLSSYPFTQCCFTFVINSVFFGITLFFKFFDKRSKRNVTRAIEGFNALISLLFLVYAIDDGKSDVGSKLSYDTREEIGWAIVVFISLVTVLTIGYQLMESMPFLISLFKFIWNCIKRAVRYFMGLDIKGEGLRRRMSMGVRRKTENVSLVPKNIKTDTSTVVDLEHTKNIELSMFGGLAQAVAGVNSAIITDNMAPTERPMQYSDSKTDRVKEEEPTQTIQPMQTVQNTQNVQTIQNIQDMSPQADMMFQGQDFKSSNDVKVEEVESPSKVRTYGRKKSRIMGE